METYEVSFRVISLDDPIIHHGTSREARHPNVVLYLGLSRAPDPDGRIFIVSEFIENGRKFSPPMYPLTLMRSLK